jgi:hypothetical protein
MKQQRPAILGTASKMTYRIELGLQEGKTAEFNYSDRFLARTHWDQLQGNPMIGGHAIKTYKFIEINYEENNG